MTTKILAAKVRAGNNDRKHFANIDELAASIAEHGLAQPITVRQVGSDYEIVAGERRFRAMTQVLGWTEIPAIVRDMDDEVASAIMLAENASREDLNPIEEAIAYRRRSEEFGWDINRIASVAGVDRERVRGRLSLLALVPEAQKLVASGQLPIGHGEAMADLDNNRQRIALRIYSRAERGMPLRDFRQIVSELFEEQSQDALFDIETFWSKQADKSTSPRRGKHAVTGMPKRKDLPKVHSEPGDTAAKIMVRYVNHLIEEGRGEEAGAIGHIFDALVHSNYMAVPASEVR